MKQVHSSKVPIIVWLEQREISHLACGYSFKLHLWLCKRTFRVDPPLIGFVKSKTGKNMHTPNTHMMPNAETSYIRVYVCFAAWFKLLFSGKCWFLKPEYLTQTSVI